MTDPIKPVNGSIDELKPKEERHLFLSHGNYGRTERQIQETIRRISIAAGQGVRTFKFFIHDTKEVQDLRAENERLKNAMKLAIANAGAPDAGDGCRLVIKTLSKALEEVETK